jgi:hypothetical protein
MSLPSGKPIKKIVQKKSKVKHQAFDSNRICNSIDQQKQEKQINSELVRKSQTAIVNATKIVRATTNRDDD